MFRAMYVLLHYFNSTMVQLRVFDLEDLIDVPDNFNSTMVQLRAVGSTTKKA